MRCHHCRKVKVAWAFATFKTRTGEHRRRGVCKSCRGLRAHKKFRYYQEYRRKYNRENRNRKAQRDRQRRYEVKRYVDRLKAKTPCADCRRKFPPICMDFDHLRAKTRSIANLVSGAYRLALIKEEITRCELVCANCHRIRTAKRKQNLAPHKIGRSPGSCNPSAKLSEKHVVSIRSDCATGESQSAVARRHRVTSSCIWNVVNRKTWRHVA
jgi:hypothetical protein